MEPSQTTPDIFRVLSLDGGGIKGTYTASVLAELEAMSGKSIGRYFDLITGTSTGGIIAIALGLGIPPREILSVYMDRGARIFPPGFWRKLWHWFGPKHNSAALEKAMKDVFGARLFGESSCRLVIPAFGAQHGSVQLFKTAHAAEYKQDHRLSATQIALSTAAAPTYFSAYSAPDGGCYVDGGVWANCPALVGFMEAFGKLRVPLERIRILSIGTTTETYSLGRRARSGGRLIWAWNVADLLMHAQAVAARGECRLLLGERFRRIDMVVAPGRFTMDGARDVGELCALGKDGARQNERMVMEEFLYAPAPQFTPETRISPR